MAYFFNRTFLRNWITNIRQAHSFFFLLNFITKTNFLSEPKEERNLHGINPNLGFHKKFAAGLNQFGVMFLYLYNMT